MAAAEQQEQGVVALLGLRLLRLGAGRVLAPLTCCLTAAGVDEPPRRNGRQPRARVTRRVLGPDPQRLEERLLEGVLGGVEVLATPDQSGEDARDEGAQGTLVQLPRRQDMTSRTSIHS